MTTIDFGELAEAELGLLRNSFRACGELCHSMTGREHLAKTCMQLIQLIEREQERCRAKSRLADGECVCLELETETAPAVAAAILAIGLSMSQLTLLGLASSGATNRCAQVCERMAAEIRSSMIQSGGEIH